MPRTTHSTTIAAAVRMHGMTAAHATMSDRLMPHDIARWNPQDCLVSVIDDAEQARLAALALREAGFLERDIRLAHAEEIIALDNAGRVRSPLARLVASMRTLGDEGLIAAEYVAEARCGHHVLIAYAPGDARKRHACELLLRYQAHTVHYFGRWVIRGLV